MKILPILIFLLALASSCGSGNSSAPIPRRHAFPRPDIPQAVYAVRDFGPYRLDISQTAAVMLDSAAGNRRDITLAYPRLGAEIYLTLSHAPDSGSLASMAADRTARFVKNVAGRYIAEESDSTESIVIVSYQGNVTPLQFVALSGLSMLSGVVYFADPDVAARPDSMRPVFEAVHRDILHLIQSFGINGAAHI